MSDTTDAPVALDLEEMTNSLNGWDELAIKKAFKGSLTTLAQADPMEAMRVLYFVQKRREGMKDGEAYNAAMDLSIKDLGEAFGASPNLDPSAESDRDKEWAEFVIGTGMNLTVHDFMGLTLNQRAEAIKAANKKG